MLICKLAVEMIAQHSTNQRESSAERRLYEFSFQSNGLFVKASVWSRGKKRLLICFQGFGKMLTQMYSGVLGISLEITARIMSS